MNIQINCNRSIIYIIFTANTKNKIIKIKKELKKLGLLNARKSLKNYF